jgi:hypothetical protein
MAPDSSPRPTLLLLPKVEWRTWSFWRSILLHPMVPVVVFIIGSVYLKKVDETVVRILNAFSPENESNDKKPKFESTGEFYPFSNFPMYANPRNRKLEYFFLEDGNGKPIASFEHTGFTAARIKKKMISESKAWGTARALTWNKKKHWLTDEARSEIAARLLVDLRKQTEDRGTPFQETMRLARALIFVNEQGKLEITSMAIASNPPRKP